MGSEHGAEGAAASAGGEIAAAASRERPLLTWSGGEFLLGAVLPMFLLAGVVLYGEVVFTAVTPGRHEMIGLGLTVLAPLVIGVAVACCMLLARTWARAFTRLAREDSPGEVAQTRSRRRLCWLLLLETATLAALPVVFGNATSAAGLRYVLEFSAPAMLLVLVLVYGQPRRVADDAPASSARLRSPSWARTAAETAGTAALIAAIGFLGGELVRPRFVKTNAGLEPVRVELGLIVGVVVAGLSLAAITWLLGRQVSAEQTPSASGRSPGYARPRT